MTNKDLGFKSQTWGFYSGETSGSEINYLYFENVQLINSPLLREERRVTTFILKGTKTLKNPFKC